MISQSAAYVKPVIFQWSNLRLKVYYWDWRYSLSSSEQINKNFQTYNFMPWNVFLWRVLGLERVGNLSDVLLFFIITVSGVIMHDLSFIFWLFSFEQFQVAVITTIISVGGLCVLWYYIDAEFYLQYLRPQVFFLSVYFGGLIVFKLRFILMAHYTFGRLRTHHTRWMLQGKQISLEIN